MPQRIIAPLAPNHDHFLDTLSMRMQGTIAKPVMLIIFICILGCVEPHTMQHSPDGLITKEGVFRLPSINANLNVSDDGSHKLRLWVVSDEGKELLRLVGHPSTYQMWAIYWDQKDSKLWYTSSDIGVFMWDVNSAGHCEQLPIEDNSELIREMPDEFFHVLPSTLQKRWALERSSQ